MKANPEKTAKEMGKLRRKIKEMGGETLKMTTGKAHTFIFLYLSL